jgi:uncharacterized membrane protein
MRFALGALVQPVAALLIPGKLFWPYFAGAVILTVGLVTIGRAKALPSLGINRAIAFGPVFFASPMAVFGADHFIASHFVATMVPSWIPWHMFWVYLVGVALIASALSIVANKHSVLAATLLSAMLFSFVLLISGPKLIASPGDRFALAVLLRDSSFSGGALACALARATEWPKRRLTSMTTLVRSVIGVTSLVFGIEHFLHPECVPVVPLKQLMPPWIPGHLFLAYVTGAVLVAAGLCLVFCWKARRAAAWLGIISFFMVLLVYLPIMVRNLSDIGSGLNYLADTLAFSGTALLLASALPVENCAVASLADPREPAAGVAAQSDEW